MKRALILGIGGQDGSFLAELLLEKGYEVHGLYRRSSYDNLARLTPDVRKWITLWQGDVTDPSSLQEPLAEIQGYPAEVYNLADQDHVGFSTATPKVSLDVTAGGCVNVLEIVARWDNKDIRVFQPVSVTMFGSPDGPVNEETKLAPNSPYACAKTLAYLWCRHYRQEYGLYISCGIMGNHDSERRGPDYLLQKIARQAVEVARKEREFVEVYNPEATVDIGYAPRYMEAAHAILQQEQPGDWVVSTGLPWSVRNVARTALHAAGVPYTETARLVRPIDGPETPFLIGDITKALRSFPQEMLRVRQICSLETVSLIVHSLQEKGK